MIGWIAGFLFEKIRIKQEIIRITISAFIGSLTNTILVISGIYLLFGRTYASIVGKSFQELLPYFLVMITTQGMLEAVVGTMIAIIVSKALLKFVK